MLLSSSAANHQRSGFSLVELLIVILVLAILLAVLLPVAGTLRTAAREVRCLGNLRQMGLASQQYAANNQGLLVPAFRAGGDGKGDWGADWAYWKHNLEFLGALGITQVDDTLPDRLRCPRSYRGTTTISRNYGLNISAPGYRFPNWWDYPPSTLVAPRISRVPGNTVLFLDALDWLVIGEWQSQGWTMAEEMKQNDADWGAKVSYRHRDRSLVVLAGGSAQRISKSQADSGSPEGYLLWRGF